MQVNKLFSDNCHSAADKMRIRLIYNMLGICFFAIWLSKTMLLYMVVQ